MKITNVTIVPSSGTGNVKGYANVTIDDCFVVHGIAIIEREDGLKISMPARRYSNGRFHDIAHPINAETRKIFEDAILAKYKETAAEEKPKTE